MRIGGSILDESERQVILMSVQCPQCGIDNNQPTNFCIKCGTGLTPSTPPSVRPNVSANYVPSYRSKSALITSFNVFGWIILVASVIGGIVAIAQGIAQGSNSYPGSAIEGTQLSVGIVSIIVGAVFACFFFWMAKVLDLLSDIRDRG